MKVGGVVMGWMVILVCFLLIMWSLLSEVEGIFCFFLFRYDFFFVGRGGLGVEYLVFF